MTIAQAALDPARTLAILIGASKWESFPSLAGSTDSKTTAAYQAAADAVRGYLRSERGLGLKFEENVLDLFDSDKSFVDQDKMIGKFLREHISDQTPSYQDLLFYFIGHGSTVINGQFIF